MTASPNFELSNNQPPVQSASTSLSLSDPTATSLARTANDNFLNELRAEIAASHRECIASMESTVEHALNAGRRLLTAQTLLEYGSWTDWIEENFTAELGLTKRTAERYMSLAKGFPRLADEFRRHNDGPDATQMSQLSDTDIARKITLTTAYRVTASFRSSGSDTSDKPKPRPLLDWLTPPEYVQRAERVLAEIECDPCAANGQLNVPARIRYTENDDGARHDLSWGKTAFVSTGVTIATSQFVDKTLRLFEAGELHEAIMVLPILADTVWPEALAKFPRAFPAQPFLVQVVGAKKLTPAKFPVVIIFIGPSKRFPAFAAEYRDICHVFVPFGK